MGGSDMRKSLLTIFALTSILISELHSDTWIVDTTGAEGDSLQAVVDAAGLSSGIDTVLVQDGTYHLAMNPDTITYLSDTTIGYTGLIMRDSVVLRSEGDRNSCILTAMSGDSADTAWHVIYCKNISESKISGVTIRDGYCSYRWTYVHVRGGGIYCDSSTLMMDSCVICYNWSNSGGGISVTNSPSVVLSNNEVSNNAAAYEWGSTGGGGIYVSRSNVVLNDNLITQNSACDDSYGGGGVTIVDSSSVTLTGNEISHNKAASGGGISGHDSDVMLNGNLIRRNRAGSAGGLHLDGDSIVIIDNVITGNRARSSSGWGSSGGLSVGGRSVTLENNDIVCDTAYILGGGLTIWADTGSRITVNNNRICRNVAGSGESGGSGGGVWVYGISREAQVTLAGNSISDNKAASGAGIRIGGIGFPWKCPVSALLVGNLIANNTGVRSGSAILVTDSSLAFLNKCVIAGNGEQAVYAASSAGVGCDSCFIVDNGEIWVVQDADTLSISHSNIYYNTFQPDTEIWSCSPINMLLANNFWWDTTESAIGAKIVGPANYAPWMSDFVPGVPGEPVSIDSVRNYANDWTTVVASIDTLDTLYLCVYGQARNPNLREAAVVILESSACPRGIAVALVETDTNSGAYQGRAYLHEAWAIPPVRLDDIYQRIRVQETGDTIRVIANTDRAMRFNIVYKGPYVEESRSRVLTSLRLTPNPFADKVVVEYEMSGKCNKRIEIYDASGRYVRKLVESSTPGLHKVIWDGKADNGKVLPQGIYFCKATAGEHTTIRKIVKLAPAR
jgi:hypothetical protein